MEKSCKERLPEEYNLVKDMILRVAGYLPRTKRWLEYNDLDPDQVESTWFDFILELGPTENTRGIKIGAENYGVVVLFSYGGPSDGLILEVGRYTKKIHRVYYFFQDWFDGAVKKVRKGSRMEQAVMDLFQDYVEYMEPVEDEE